MHRHYTRWAFVSASLFAVFLSTAPASPVEAYEARYSGYVRAGRRSGDQRTRQRGRRAEFQDSEGRAVADPVGGTLRRPRHIDRLRTETLTKTALSTVDEDAWTKFESAETNSRRSTWVRVFRPGQAQRLVEHAVRRARAALEPDGVNEGVTVEHRDGRTFINVAMSEVTGTVDRVGNGWRPPSNEARHLEIAISDGEVEAVYPALAPMDRQFRVRRAREATDRALESAERAPLSEGAIRTYLEPNEAPIRVGKWRRTAPNHEPRRHSVFAGGEEAAREVVDEAWNRARAVYARRREADGGRIRTRNGHEIVKDGVTITESDDGGLFVTVDMGRTVGHIDGRLGASLGHPEANRIQMVVQDGQVTNAIPISLGPTPARFSGGDVIGPEDRRHTLPQGGRLVRVDHPERALSMEEAGQRLAEAMVHDGASAVAQENMARIATRGTHGVQSVGELSATARLRVPARNVMLGVATMPRNRARFRTLVRNGYTSSFKAGVGVLEVDYFLGPENVALNPVERQEDFRPDATLPPEIRTRDEEYGELSAIDFHRGHLFSSGVQNESRKRNSWTFPYANVIPQAARNNTGAWNGLEQYMRLMIRQGRQLHVTQGALYLGHAPRINGRMRVPSHTYAVVTVANEDGTVDENSRVISILVPNNNYETARDDNWLDYRVTPETIERLSTLDKTRDGIANHGEPVRFFRNLPRELARSLARRRDNHAVPESITQMRSYLPNAVEANFRLGAYPEQPAHHIE